MADTNPKTILLKGENVVYEEKLANAAIRPGDLIEKLSTDKFQKHSTASGNAVKRFAVEDDTQGNGISTNYASGALVKSVLPRPGDMIYAWLANGQSVVIGDLLESAGDGSLQKHVPDPADSTVPTIYPASVIAEASEAVDMSDSSAADPNGRVKITII